MPDGSTGMFVMHRLSIRHHNKSYDYENNNKTGKNQNSVENCEKCRSQLNRYIFCESFICDPLDVISKPMGLE